MARCLLVTVFAFLISLVLLGCGTAASNQNSSTTPPPGSGPALPLIQLSASPSSINQGAFTTLSWSAKNATSISFSPSLEFEDSSPPLSGSTEVAPQQTTTYTATASGKGGTASGQVTITVMPPLPTISFVATPDVVLAGSGSATLSWTAQNATSLSIGGVGSVPLPSGSVAVSPSATTTYTATAAGMGGTASSQVTVKVTKLAFSSTPDSIAPGQSVTLSWNSPSATLITIDNGIGPVQAPSGQIPVSPTVTTRYTATATDPNGNTWTNSTLVVVSQAGTGFTNIKHIIFFVQENRSADNYFGQMPEYRASEGLDTGFDGLPAGVVLFDKEGQAVQPYHFQTVCHQNLPPSWYWAWNSYDNGKMDGFVVQAESMNVTYDPYGTRAMGYYDQSDLPYYYEAAAQFATSDRFFSPIMTSTVPNRMYLFAATSFGNVYAPTTKTIGGWTQPTIFDALDKAGVSWRYYYQDSSVFLSQWSTWNRDASKVWNISHWYTDIQNEGTLPQVIFIERASQLALDEHPSSNIQTGAADAEHIINALLQSQAWASSVLIFTYDEGGGLYDHVSPVTMPAPDNIPPPQFVGGDFKHTGFRIPLIVLSPWVRPHFVSHVNRDSTAILKLIETRFGVPSLTARDAAQDDMTEFFDFSAPHLLTPPPLPAQPVNGVCSDQLERAPGF